MTLSWLLPWCALLWPVWLSRRSEVERPTWMRRALLILLSILTWRYLYWRGTESLNLDSPASTALSVVFLLAEAWLLLTGLLPMLMAWRQFSDGISEASHAESEWRDSAWRPWVDVLVPTCGEPLVVLERCLHGCQKLKYPYRKLWLLDDIGRPELIKLAASYGFNYHHRACRLHAKAGNLNAGLALCEGELIAVFDADFVPQSHFLDRTIGLLMDPQVALVQTPQSFFNADPIMRNLGLEDWLLPDEESFYRWVQPVRGAWEAVVCAGTSFVVKRAALDCMDGFVEAAISEDFVTGVALAGRGWRLLYLAEKLSAGLAPESMLDYVRQRQRWASGTLQALRLPQGPLRQKGLHWSQRIAYLEGCVHWLNTLPRLILLLMPLSIGFLGILPAQFTLPAIMTFLLPLWISLLLSVGWLTRGSRHALLSELPGWALAVPLATTVIMSLWGRVRPFRPTPKHQIRSSSGVAMQLAIPLSLLLILSTINLIAVLYMLWNGGASVNGFLALTWAAVNPLVIVVALRASWDVRRIDPTPWLSLELPAVVKTSTPEGECRLWAGRISALSQAGAIWLPDDNAASGEVTQMVIQLLDDGEKSLAIPMKPGQQINSTRGEVLYWDVLGPKISSGLISFLFCRPGAWPDRHARPEFHAFLALLRHLFIASANAQRISCVSQRLTPVSEG